jgi:hypothetical protein
VNVCRVVSHRTGLADGLCTVPSVLYGRYGTVLLVVVGWNGISVVSYLLCRVGWGAKILNSFPARMRDEEAGNGRLIDSFKSFSLLARSVIDLYDFLLLSSEIARK